jgi:hypothetical protein
MTPRIMIAGLILFLVVTPFLGFAGGDAALQIWNKHPRHAQTQQTDSSSFAWKTTPGTVTSVSSPVVLGLAGEVAAWSPMVVRTLVPRPPFVPPRA